MTIREQVLRELYEKGKLKEYDVVDLNYMGYYQKYGTNIIRHNETPTILTKSHLLIMVDE